MDAHRRRHGPYTAAGAVVRALVPEMLTRDPDLVRRYDIELLSAAPDLAAIVPSSRETLTSMAIPAERTRFYALLRTKRIANGLVEFVTGALDQLPGGAAGGGPRTLVVENVHEADATDLEFLAAVVRRVDPGRLTLVACSPALDLPDAAVAGELRRRARIVAGPGGRGAAAGAAHGAGREADLAWQFVVADGTSDDPATVAAYQALDPGERARLHDRRAGNWKSGGS